MSKLLLTEGPRRVSDLTQGYLARDWMSLFQDLTRAEPFLQVKDPRLSFHPVLLRSRD